MLFRDNAAKDTAAENNARPPERPAPPVAPVSPVSAASAPTPTAATKVLKESVLSAELTIEGKIEGAGHVRIAGRFKGDVHVQGNVTIEQGAVVTGEVKAEIVIIAGQ